MIVVTVQIPGIHVDIDFSDVIGDSEVDWQMFESVFILYFGPV